MNPINEFIQVAADCPLREARIPAAQGGKKSVASAEYELLSSQPYGYTLAELKLATYLLRNEIPPAELGARRQQLRDEFLAKSHACMRASPLTKQYGWGAHYDGQGRIAIYPIESEEYQRFVNDPGIKKHFAMRSRRA